MEDSVLMNVTRGILFEYLNKKLTQQDIKQITAQVVKSFMMTRVGANLPEKGVANNFSENEVKGKIYEADESNVDNQPHFDEKAEIEEKEREAELALLAKEEKRKAKEERKAAKALADKKKKEAAKPKTKVKAIIASPIIGENGEEDVGPIAYRSKI